MLSLRKLRTLLIRIYLTVIVDGFKKACQKAIKTLKEAAIDTQGKDFLNKIARTSMASEIVSGNSIPI